MPGREKIAYLVNSAQKRLLGKGRVCPSCGERDSVMVARKYVVTELRRCAACRLMYRAPTSDSTENAAFYQDRYSQGFTTEFPSPTQLAELTAKGFKGTEKDYTPYVDVLRALGVPAGATLLDFGCSWGYGSWQLARAGFRVSSFEISRPRCDFAREQLGVNATSRLADLSGPFDVMFSAHVLEHVPAIAEVLSLARRLLNPNGLFVAFTPNGDEALRKRDPQGWMQLWGMVHPNFLDPVYYRGAFAGDQWLMASSPYDHDAIRRWTSSTQNGELGLGGDELLLAARLRPAAK